MEVQRVEHAVGLQELVAIRLLEDAEVATVGRAGGVIRLPRSLRRARLCRRMLGVWSQDKGETDQQKDEGEQAAHRWLDAVKRARVPAERSLLLQGERFASRMVCGGV